MESSITPTFRQSQHLFTYMLLVVLQNYTLSQKTPPFFLE